jgi:hypothetical protein
MKVNITGKGIIPIKELRCLAPVYNRDLNESQIRLMMKYRQFRVTKADTMESINPYSIAKIFKSEKEKNSVKLSEPVVVETVKQDIEEKAKGTRIDPIQQIINEYDEAFDIMESEEIDALPVTPIPEQDKTVIMESNEVIDEFEPITVVEEETSTFETSTEEETNKNVYGTSTFKKNKKKRNR